MLFAPGRRAGWGTSKVLKVAVAVEAHLLLDYDASSIGRIRRHGSCHLASDTAHTCAGKADDLFGLNGYGSTSCTLREGMPVTAWVVHKNNSDTLAE